MVLPFWQPLPKRQISDSFQTEKRAENNIKFEENGRKFSNWVENTPGGGGGSKRRNYLLPAISPFPTVFSKKMFSRHIKTSACFEKI